MRVQYKKKWFMLDLASQRSFCRKEVEDLLCVLEKCGYNGIGLYLAGAFKFPEFGGFLHEGCMSPEDAAWIKEQAAKRGMSVMPMTNLYTNAETFLAQEKFQKFMLTKADPLPIYDVLHKRVATRNAFDITAEGFMEFALSVVDQLVEVFRPEFLHLGGNDVTLETEEDKRNHAVFFTALAEHLNKKGVRAAIWGDTIQKYYTVAQLLTKDITVFDWNYYGHKYGTSHKLKRLGFNDIVACPGTQSWSGVVATQHVGPDADLMTRWKLNVAPDEVEAFLRDTAAIDIDNAMLCDWGNYYGTLLWNGMHQIARFGQYVNCKPTDDEVLSQTLFGRQTPYMQAMQALMEAQYNYSKEYSKLPGNVKAEKHETAAIFNVDALKNTIIYGSVFSPEVVEGFANAADKAKGLSEGWTAASDIEARCKKSLAFAACYAEAMAVVLRLAGETKKVHREAAPLQYTEPQKYSELIKKEQSDFYAAAGKVDGWIDALREAITDTGHTAEDLDRLAETKKRFESLAKVLDYFDVGGVDYNNEIALVDWAQLVFEAFGVVYPYTYSYMEH